MNNVIAFPEPKAAPTRDRAAGKTPITLYIHIRRATLIPHKEGGKHGAPTADECARENKLSLITTA